MYAKDILYSQRLDQNYKFDSRSNITELQKSLKLTAQHQNKRPEDREELRKSSQFVRNKQVLFKDYYELQRKQETEQGAAQPHQIAVQPTGEFIASPDPALTQSEYFNGLLRDLPREYVENIQMGEQRGCTKAESDAGDAPAVQCAREEGHEWARQSTQPRDSLRTTGGSGAANTDLQVQALQSAGSTDGSVQRARSNGASFHDQLQLQIDAMKQIKQVKAECQEQLARQKADYEARIAQMQEQFEQDEGRSGIAGDADNERLIQQLLLQNKKNHEHIKELQAVIQRQQTQNAALTQQLQQSRAEAQDQYTFIQSVLNEDTSKIAGQVQAFHENLGESACDLALTRWKEE